MLKTVQWNVIIIQIIIAVVVVVVDGDLLLGLLVLTDHVFQVYHKVRLGITKCDDYYKVRQNMVNVQRATMELWMHAGGSFLSV